MLDKLKLIGAVTLAAAAVLATAYGATHLWQVRPETEALAPVKSAEHPPVPKPRKSYRD
jgi:hypothetical protein